MQTAEKVDYTLLADRLVWGFVDIVEELERVAQSPSGQAVIRNEWESLCRYHTRMAELLNGFPPTQGH